MSDQCVKCRRALEQTGTGRPKAYCGEGCRRAAEHEVRRISRRLERLEDERRVLAHTTREAFGNYMWKEVATLGRTLAQARKDVAEDIAADEARLLALVGGDE